MKYYKVKVKLGHVGRCKEISTWVYVKAKDILKAIAKARKIPAVKHSQLPLTAVEITEEEYIKGLEENTYYTRVEQILGD